MSPLPNSEFKFDGENTKMNLPPNIAGFRCIYDPEYLIKEGDLVTEYGAPYQWARGWAGETLGWLQKTNGIELDVWVRDDSPAAAPAEPKLEHKFGPLPGTLDGYEELPLHETLERGDLVVVNGVPSGFIDADAGRFYSAWRPGAGGWTVWRKRAVEAEKRALDETPETPEMDDVHVVTPNYAEELVGAVHATHALSATFEVEMGGHRYTVAVTRDDIYSAHFSRRSTEDKR